MLRPSLSIALLLLLGCDPNLIQNSRVQRWCEDRPCGWQAEGEIERVGSWHDHDYAVSFVNDDARLSQFSATGGPGGPSCFAFTMVAKIDPGVRMFLELDFLDDGAIDFRQRLPESDFDQLRFLITPPEWYSGVRFILRKEGPGRAVLAELSAQTSNECTAPPVMLLPRPDGIECETDADCANGRCHYFRCGGCVADGESCIDDKVCGLEPLGTGYVPICVEQAQDELGDRCLTNAECASDICCQGACSECCTNADCGGDDCARPGDFPLEGDDALLLLQWPLLCAPDSRTRAAGDACASDDDCASLRCAGAKLRGCDFECSPDKGGFCLYPCETTRVYGGTCE